MSKELEIGAMNNICLAYLAWQAGRAGRGVDVEKPVESQYPTTTPIHKQAQAINPCHPRSNFTVPKAQPLQKFFGAKNLFSPPSTQGLT